VYQARKCAFKQGLTDIAVQLYTETGDIIKANTCIGIGRVGVSLPLKYYICT